MSAQVCALWAARGLVVPDEAKHYLRPRLNRLLDPALLSGVDVAVARINRAVDTGERIRHRRLFPAAQHRVGDMGQVPPVGVRAKASHPVFLEPIP